MLGNIFKCSDIEVVMNEKLSVVIPCYNSEKNIRGVIENDIQIFKNLKIENYEFILVNDCSPDNTWEVLQSLSKENEHIIAINLAKNAGQHGAIMAGFNYVSGEYVVVSDDDGQTQMEMIGTMIEKMQEGYDVVSTEWVDRGKRSLLRRIGTAVNQKMTDILMDNPKGVVVSIFFLAKRYIIDEMIKYKNPYPYVIGLVLRTTHNIATIQVKQLERKSGQSGYSLRKLLKLWLNGVTAFSVVPLRIATYIGSISAVCGFVYGVIIIIRKIVNTNIVVGWSSIVAILLFMVGLVLCVLGMIGEYVGRIYMCINNTPQYIIKEYIGHSEE